MPYKKTNIPSNVLTEEMTVTPDMPHIDQVEDTYFTPSHNCNSLTNGLSLVTPETGYHFLYSSYQPPVGLTEEPKLKLVLLLLLL